MKFNNVRVLSFDTKYSLDITHLLDDDLAYVIEEDAFYFRDKSIVKRVGGFSHGSGPIETMVDFTTNEPLLGDYAIRPGARFINTGTGKASVNNQEVTATYIYEWNGNDWIECAPKDGSLTFDKESSVLLVFNNGAWMPVLGGSSGVMVSTELTDSGDLLRKSDIVDNLTSTDTDKPLSALQGKILNDKIDAIPPETVTTFAAAIIPNIFDANAPTLRMIYENEDGSQSPADVVIPIPADINTNFSASIDSISDPQNPRLNLTYINETRSQPPVNVVIPIPDEVVTSTSPLLGTAPAGAQFGVNTTNGTVYYVTGGNWAPVPVATVDLNTTISNETGSDGSGLAIPSNPPVGTPDPGDLHIEVYDDVTMYYTATGNDWLTAAVTEIPRNVANPPIITTLAASVDTTDEFNPVVTITYVNEDSTQAPINLTIPIPTEIDIVEDFGGSFTFPGDYAGTKEFVELINTGASSLVVTGLAGNDVTILPNEKGSFTFYDGSWYSATKVNSPNSNVYSSSASIVDMDAILADRNAVNGEGQTFSIIGSGSRTFSSTLPINVNANGTLVNIPANSSVAIPAGAFGYYFSDGNTIWFSYQLVENSAESGDASNLNGATQDLTGNLLSLLSDRVAWHFHTRQPTTFTAPSMNVTADGEDIAVGVSSHTVPDGAQGFAIRVNGAYQVMYQTLGTGASTDPISTEVGNLIILGDDGEEYALPEVDRECAYYTVDGNPNKFNNSDTSPSVETITTDLTFDLVPAESYLGNTLTIQMFGGNSIPVQETYVLQIIGGSVNELRPINPIGSGNLVWDISGIIFQNGVTYSCTILNSAGDDVRVDNIPSANNFLINTSLSGGAIPVSIFNGTTIAYYTEITYSDGETSKTIYVEDGSITPLETQPTGTRVAVSCLSSLDKTEITELINKQNKDFVRTSCFEEVGATLAPVNNAAFADEINPTQLATLPAGAHMRWVSQTERVLNTLQVNGFGDGVAVISWLTEGGVSGSGSVTFTGGNPYDLALGDLTLAAGEYIDFTLESLSVGQMQLTTESASIANGWIALQDYSAFAPATSHWATILLTSEPNITHKVNLYEDDAGATIYKEVVGDDLTTVDVTGWTEIDCPVVVETTCTDVTETFTAGPTNNGGTGTGPTGLAVTSITINEPQDITVVHTGTGFTGAAGSGLGVSSIPVGDNSAEVNGSDIFTSGADRIFDATPSKTYTVTLPNAGKYYIGVFSGGISSVTSHTLDITYCKPDVVITPAAIVTKSIDCYESPNFIVAYDERNATTTGTFGLGRLETQFEFYAGGTPVPFEGVVVRLTNTTANPISITGELEDLNQSGFAAVLATATLDIQPGTAEYFFAMPGLMLGDNNAEGYDILWTSSPNNADRDLVTMDLASPKDQSVGQFFTQQGDFKPKAAWVTSPAGSIPPTKISVITLSDDTQMATDEDGNDIELDIASWTKISCESELVQQQIDESENDWVKEECYIIPSSTYEFTTNAPVSTNNGDMLQASGAVAPSGAPLRLSNADPVPFQVNTIKVRAGANGFVPLPAGNLTIGGVQYVATSYENINGIYRTVVFEPNTTPLVIQPLETFTSQGNWAVMTGGFQGPVSSAAGANPPFGGLTQARAEINYTAGTLEPEEIVTVRTYEDGSLVLVDKTSNTFTELATIDPTWTKTTCLTTVDEVRIVELNNSLQYKTSPVIPAGSVTQGSINTDYANLMLLDTDGNTWVSSPTGEMHLLIRSDYARVEEITLATLAANTPTPVPTTFAEAYTIDVRDTAGTQLEMEITGNLANPVITSNVALSNIKIRIIGK